MALLSVKERLIHAIQSVGYGKKYITVSTVGDPSRPDQPLGWHVVVSTPTDHVDLIVGPLGKSFDTTSTFAKVSEPHPEFLKRNYLNTPGLSVQQVELARTLIEGYLAAGYKGQLIRSEVDCAENQILRMVSPHSDNIMSLLCIRLPAPVPSEIAQSKTSMERLARFITRIKNRTRNKPDGQQ